MADEGNATPRFLLLVGRPGSGKTTLVKKVVGEVARKGLKLSGFFTEEIREGGERKGFLVENLNGERAVFAHVDFRSKPRVSRYGVDISIFERVALHSLEREFPRSDLVVIDEIGKMELLSPKFLVLLAQILAFGKMVLATSQERGDLLKHTPLAGEPLQLYRMSRESGDALSSRLVEDILRMVRPMS